MDETQTLRAEVEALKLIVLSLVRTLPEGVRAAWQSNTTEQLKTYEEMTLYWKYTDQQRDFVRLTAATLLELPPDDESSQLP